MAYKIAVASTDGEHIDTHFGHADHFLIYEVYEESDAGHEADSFEALEDREAFPACGGRNKECEGNDSASDPMEAAARNLSDVSYVLCAMAGPHAVKTLSRYGITVFSVVLPIDEAVRKINAYRKRTGEAGGAR